ncbi:hypothetical protein [Caballeronia concitans]|uniref:hypothetical protein n=1 Tax=Caballeronia concitans TaxID=1777133 RepID=UPI0005922084|nr:hypothetical protein [Caballeronia concitans]KIG09591.1 hypothetical protein BurMR1_3078 [Burkholderia sp. MR1]
MSNAGRVHAATAVALTLAGSSLVYAQPPIPDISELANAAQMVVQSRVSKVEYRMSEAGAQGQPSLPNTIVTYEVLRSVRGDGPSTMTLRYAGGPDGRGHVYQLSNVPVFQVGDEDVLFVETNGAAACPLVNCGDGRFRVLNGAIYDGTGVPVQAVRNNKVVTGGAPESAFGKTQYPAPAFDELMKNPEARRLISKSGLTLEEARNRYQAQAPKTIELESRSGGDRNPDSAGKGPGQSVSRSAEQQAAIQPMSVDAFVAAVQAVRTNPGKAQSYFRSVDPNARIPAPEPQPTAPPVVPQSGSAAARSSAGVAEDLALPKDDSTITERKQSSQ